MGKPRQRPSHAPSSLSKRKKKTKSPAVVPLQKPVSLPNLDDRDGWKAHWIAQGQSWRTEPEIAQKRQAELEQHRAIVPDIEKGIYPFGNMKLDRADVEWLLSTHENGRGPVNWNDVSQRERQGLDLRGADLNDANLRYLPLAKLIGGLDGDEWSSSTREQQSIAAIHLERARLRAAHLEGSILNEAHLCGAQLNWAHLESIDAFRAHFDAPVPASMRGVYFDSSTKLEQVILANDKQIGAIFLDVHWEGVNLTGIDWSSVQTLYKVPRGQDSLREQRELSRAYGQLSIELRQQGMSDDASRFAYLAQVHMRQLSFLQITRGTKPFRQRLSLGRTWLFSWFLFLIAGYGYRPGRSFLTYVLVIFGFATTYYLLGHALGPTLSPLGALVLSMTSFHGRGFFPGNNISLDDPLTVLAAFEALVGLIIEVTFIATLTQRFFNR